MHRREFDDLTRLFAIGGSRRRFVAALLGLAPIGAGLTTDDAAAVPSGRRQICRAFGVGCSRGAQCCTGYCETGRLVDRRRRNRCSCPAGLGFCNGACVDLQSSELHCSDCWSACESGDICCSGVCTELGGVDNCASCGNVCTGDTFCCNSACTESSDDNCGACGAACGGGEACVSGVCQCGDGPECDAINGETCCAGVCTELGTDDNCTACGEVCDTGTSCQGVVDGCQSPCLAYTSGFLTTDSPQLYIPGTTANAAAYSYPHTPCTTSADCPLCVGMDQTGSGWTQTGCGCLYWSCGGGGQSLTGMAEGPADVCGVVWSQD